MGKIELYVASLDDIKNCTFEFWMHVIAFSYIHFSSSCYSRSLNLTTSLQNLEFSAHWMCNNWSSLCSWVDAVAETSSCQIGIRFVTNELIFFFPLFKESECCGAVLISAKLIIQNVKSWICSMIISRLIFCSWAVGHLILTPKQEAQLGPQIMFEIWSRKRLGVK